MEPAGLRRAKQNQGDPIKKAPCRLAKKLTNFRRSIDELATVADLAILLDHKVAAMVRHFTHNKSGGLK
jgi:hypothetical protein